MTQSNEPATNTTINSDSDIIGSPEAAKLVGLKESRIRYMVLREEIPFLKIGKSVRFSRTDLLEWLELKKNNAGLISNSRIRHLYLTRCGKTDAQKNGEKV